jgi:predicted nuclease of predicted toxin-antitoxin system
MWLLDVNTDVRLVEVLAEFGIKAETAASRGWRELSNGELVRATATAGFTCLVTRDELFMQSAARTLKLYPEFAIVLLRLPQMRRQTFIAAFRTSWASEPIRPAPGKLLSWPTIAG